MDGFAVRKADSQEFEKEDGSVLTGGFEQDLEAGFPAETNIDIFGATEKTECSTGSNKVFFEQGAMEESVDGAEMRLTFCRSGFECVERWSCRSWTFPFVCSGEGEGMIVIYRRI